MKPKFLKESMKFVLERCWSYTILYFPIAHNALCLPLQILHKLLFSNYLGKTVYSQNNSLCKIWGANKVYYGQLENRE